jgi:RsiW-degrading membrane proteinase PrsW (M82 family)
MTNENQPVPTNWRMNAMVARFVGIVAIALGFILGMYGLDEQGAQWLQTALGLLVTGMLAQGYALYCSVKRMQQLHDRSNT